MLELGAMVALEALGATWSAEVEWGTLVVWSVEIEEADGVERAVRLGNAVFKMWFSRCGVPLWVAILGEAYAVVVG